MTKPTQIAVGDDDVYTLTKRGEAELRGAKTALSPVALELLIRIDGKTSVSALRASMAGTALVLVDETLAALLGKGLVEISAADSDLLEFREFSGLAAPLVPSAAALSQAGTEAAAGVTSLERQGYYVRIARQPADRPSLPKDRKPNAVIVEDEPHLAGFLKHFLTFEGFEARVAGNREEIVQTLRTPPRPDLILLDVMLPDADGFDVLMKIRQHAALRAVPIIMLTAKTTREAVIKGLAGGADGYITKPFQTDVLIRAIKTMFGMEHGKKNDPWEPNV